MIGLINYVNRLHPLTQGKVSQSTHGNLTFTKPATSSSKHDDDGEKRREVDSEYRFHLISSGLLASQPGLACPACLTLEIGNFD